MKIVFATHNANKLMEVRKLLPPTIQLLSLEDIGCMEDIPETGETLEENAKIKADHVTKNYGYDCFSDDTGLLIDALDGNPGVYSARYAGLQKNSDDNMCKVLEELHGKENRAAHFKTVIHLNFKKNSFSFNGKVNGTITNEKMGSDGFGYDPIFKPDGYQLTFGELPIEIKNSISHRAEAIKKLVQFFEKNQ